MEWELKIMTDEDEVKVKSQMQELGEIISLYMPDKFGFVLMIFKLGADEQLNYVSNCDRHDVIKALKEFIQKTERGWGKDLEEGKFGTGKHQ